MDNLDTAHDAGPGELAGLPRASIQERQAPGDHGGVGAGGAAWMSPGARPMGRCGAEPAVSNDMAWPVGIDPGIDPGVPSPARIYDYCLGGKDNLAADREAAEKALSVVPQGREVARSNRRFLIRAVRYMASHGVAQFIDLGTGFPTPPSVHETAAALVDGPRVVYVDNDPMVTCHNPSPRRPRQMSSPPRWTGSSRPPAARELGSQLGRRWRKVPERGSWTDP